jgi:hypothetical protein
VTQLIEAALFPADEHGCGYYRMRLPADHVAVLTSLHERVKTRTRPNLAHGTVELLHVDVGDADVAVFQRPLDKRLVPIIEKLKLQGVATVVELDDDLCSVDPMHAAFPGMHPSFNPHQNWNHLKAACRAADVVTVSTPALARRYAGHGRVVVLPNCVPERLLEVEADKQHAVGWAGVLGTHPRDLDVLGDSIKQLGYGLAVVGEADYPGAKLHAADILGLPRESVLTSGWVRDLDEYWQQVATFGCGLVPLANSAFNHAKSNLKGLEYAALGVPFVASPLPEYVALAALGAGRLAAKPKRWVRQIEHSLADDEAAERGRAVVREHFTIEGQAWRWAEAWEHAVRARHKAGRRGLVTA